MIVGPSPSEKLQGTKAEAGDVGFIVDAAGCSQARKGPFEARLRFPTQPTTSADFRAFIQCVIISDAAGIPGRSSGRSPRIRKMKRIVDINSVHVPHKFMPMLGVRIVVQWMSLRIAS